MKQRSEEESDRDRGGGLRHRQRQRQRTRGSSLPCGLPSAARAGPSGLGRLAALAAAGWSLVQLRVLWVASPPSPSSPSPPGPAGEENERRRPPMPPRQLELAASVPGLEQGGRQQQQQQRQQKQQQPPSRRARENGTDYWPPLDELLGRRPNGDWAEAIVGDVSHLLDFVVAGHPKTGTTSLMRWLGSHPGVFIEPHEVQSDLKIGRPDRLVRELHARYSPQKWTSLRRKRRAAANWTEAEEPEEVPFNSVLKGYKAPNEIHFRTGLRFLARHWPNAKLVVGVRHPVTYFNSWYNFKVNNGVAMPPPESYNAELDLPPIMRFHENLSLLGKTPMGEDERLLLGPPRRAMTVPQEDEILTRKGLDPSDRSPVPNRVFLYDASQADGDKKVEGEGASPSSSERFRSELGSFLGISALAERPRENEQTRRTFDVCRPEFGPLRARLARLGGEMSEWILDHFVGHPDVAVCGPPERFVEAVRSWSADPCEDKKDRAEADAEGASLASARASEQI